MVTTAAAELEAVRRMLGTLQVGYTDAAVAWMAGLSRPHRSDTPHPPREPPRPMSPSHLVDLATGSW